MKVIMTLDKIFMVCDVMLYIYAFRIEFEDTLSKIFLTVVIVSFIVFEAISYELEIKKPIYVAIVYDFQMRNCCSLHCQHNVFLPGLGQCTLQYMAESKLKEVKM